MLQAWNIEMFQDQDRETSVFLMNLEKGNITWKIQVVDITIKPCVT